METENCKIADIPHTEEKMKKIITTVLACFLIAGCSSTPKTENASCSYTQEGLMTATYDLKAEKQ